MAKRKLKTSNKFKFSVVFVLIAMLIVGLCSTVFMLDKHIETKEVSSTVFKYGRLDTDGDYVESKAALYTSDYLTVNGLKIEIDEDAEITYSIYFYDEDYNLVQSKSDLSVDYVYETIVENPSYCKIVITPTNDKKISWYEKSGYAKQLSITVEKER